MDIKEHLEGLHKEALDRKVAGIHRSTKTLFKIFEPLHFKLRDKSRWYYRWHASPISTFTHWAILIVSLGILIYSGFLFTQTSAEAEKIPQRQLQVTGPENIGDKKAVEGEKSNIKKDKSKIELEDKKITIGFVREKANLGELVSWKNIEWSADIPEGTSIVYRTKIANEDKEDTWNKMPWSNYYPIAGKGISEQGIPSFKSLYIEIEIVLEGDGKATPTLDYVKFGYTPFRENKIVAFLRDKLVSGIGKIFQFFAKREGI